MKFRTKIQSSSVNFEIFQINQHMLKYSNLSAARRLNSHIFHTYTKNKTLHHQIFHQNRSFLFWCEIKGIYIFLWLYGITLDFQLGNGLFWPIVRFWEFFGHILSGAIEFDIVKLKKLKKLNYDAHKCSKTTLKKKHKKKAIWRMDRFKYLRFFDFTFCGCFGNF